MEKHYPIDTIVVSTIKRARTRHWTQLGCSQHPMCAIPEELLNFYCGPDALDHDKDLSKVAAAAKQDGFEWVEEYALGTRTEYVQQTAASVCQIWAYAQILRYFVEEELTGLILWDDKILTVPFEMFCDTLMYLKDVDKPFYLWQLCLRGDIDELGIEDLPAAKRVQQSQNFFGALVQGNMGSPIGFLLQEGIRGYDESIVFSPEGAAWMLDQLASARDFHTFLDSFIAYELSAICKGSKHKGKGFYSPAEFGYNFADVYMAQGSLTDWAPEGTAHYEDSRRKIKPRYIEIQGGTECASDSQEYRD